MKLKNIRTREKDLKFLKFFSRLGKDDIKILIPLLKRSHLDLICSTCSNILFSENGMKLSKHRIRKIQKIAKPHSKRFKTLANKFSSLNQKKKIISQEGSGLGTIIGLAIPLITSLFSRK